MKTAAYLIVFLLLGGVKAEEFCYVPRNNLGKSEKGMKYCSQWIFNISSIAAFKRINGARIFSIDGVFQCGVILWWRHFNGVFPIHKDFILVLNKSGGVRGRSYFVYINSSFYKISLSKAILRMSKKYINPKAFNINTGLFLHYWKRCWWGKF